MTTEEKIFMVSLTGEQLRYLSEAANLVSRLYMGQMEDLTYLLKGVSNAEGIREKVEELVTLVFPEKATQEPQEPTQILFDIHQVFRNVLAWEENPDGGSSIEFDDPLSMSSRPLPLVVNKESLIDLINEHVKNILNSSDCLNRGKEQS